MLSFKSLGSDLF